MNRPLLPTRSVCGCHAYLGATGCSWERFVRTLPADDELRVAWESGADVEWTDRRWNHGSCECECHDGDDP
jgi:hypothetical protein